MALLIKLIILLATFYLLFGSLILLLLYKETRGHIDSYKDDPLRYGLTKEPFIISLSESISIAGWLFRHEQPKALVIMCHGYSRPGGKEGMVWHANYVYRAGFDVALFDYRGFGESKGYGITFGKTESEDTKAVYEYLTKNKKYRNVPVILYGKSMGGATVLIAAGKYGIGDVVISAVPYKSFYSLIAHQAKKRNIPVWLFYPFVYMGLYLFVGSDYRDYTAEKQSSQIAVPVLIVGAKYDKEINPYDFIDLYNANKNNTQLVWIESGHDVRRDAPEEYKKTVLSFLNVRF